MNDFRDREPSCVSAESGNYNGFLWLLTSPAKSDSKGFQLKRQHHFRMSDSTFHDGEEVICWPCKREGISRFPFPPFFPIETKAEHIGNRILGYINFPEREEMTRTGSWPLLRGEVGFSCAVVLEINFLKYDFFYLSNSKSRDTI